MRVQLIREFGSSSVFEAADIPTPELKPGHVLIEVKASSVNPMDYKVRGNGPPIAPELPAVLHADVSGVVTGVGEGIGGFRVGDEVYGCAGGVKGQGGALAEFMLADARLIAKKPATLDFPEAAALPLVTLTAWEGLIDKADVRAGQRVLVHGGAGGVGHIAVQLAKWHGAHVTATAGSAEKLQLARELGADKGVNYREESVQAYVARLTGGRGFDVVFDSAGGDNLLRSFEAAKLNGTVITPSSLRGACGSERATRHRSKPRFRRRGWPGTRGAFAARASSRCLNSFTGIRAALWGCSVDSQGRRLCRQSFCLPRCSQV